jgi:hypothetical protein
VGDHAPMAKLLQLVAVLYFYDLLLCLPDLKGFSSSNLKYCKRFYLFYQIAIGQQVVEQFFQQCRRLASDGSSFTMAYLSNKPLDNFNHFHGFGTHLNPPTPRTTGAILNLTALAASSE